MSMTIAERVSELRELLAKLRMTVPEVPTDPSAAGVDAHKNAIGTVLTSFTRLLGMCRAVGVSMLVDDDQMIKSSAGGKIIVDLTDIESEDIVVAPTPHVEFVDLVELSAEVSLRMLMLQMQLGIEVASDDLFREVKNAWLARTAGKDNDEPRTRDVLKSHFPKQALLFR